MPKDPADSQKTFNCHIWGIISHLTENLCFQYFSAVHKSQYLLFRLYCVVKNPSDQPGKWKQVPPVQELANKLKNEECFSWKLSVDTVTLPSYINYVTDERHASCKADAGLTLMSTPFPPHALMALDDKWVAALVMTHNDTACPLQWAKPIFFHHVRLRIGIGYPQAIYSRPRQAKRMWRPNVF